MEIRSKVKFLEALHQVQSDQDIQINHYNLTNLFNNQPNRFVKINREHFKNISFSDLRLTGFDFIECTFERCGFSDTIILSCLFKSCTFVNSSFTMTKIFESEFDTTKIISGNLSLVHFADCSFRNVEITKCFELLDIYWGNCIFEGMCISDSSVVYSRFDKSHHQVRPQIQFSNCFFTRNYLTNLNLAEIKFNDGSTLSLNVFQNCFLSKNSFHDSVSCSGKEFNSIDFATISKSEFLNEKSLMQLFGIIHPNIKEYVYGLTNEVVFQSLFISYSFKNREFAKKLNSSLIERGIMTFMWEKDAPGGKGLKRIMKENVEKFDRILFLSSEDSIRSKACQFELTEGRKKQAKLWKEIFFPIHIDKYLFEVQKDNIRPVSKQKEYWANICELRKMNSIDFSEFILNHDEEEYSKKIYKLIRNLKK